ncbi:lysin B [Mycobacterium phage Phipps]|uniref:Lysin B n=2 Tax=Pegunavirus soto TaxID=1982928 RepID=A0A088FPU5_9CAUD|nr:lysin B [Mycobacterium phage Phipps]AIM49787.1 lysin B [Mycobacterium phage Lasso]ATN92370.1 lysin B [Mycobacterium phage Virapocalypse]AVD99993.1 lysin B [Mycobacterium phage JangoPhett]AXQ64854.1 lysin B [Mycobacterium phage Podrick]AZF98575.1 lysin B [Mycobacterium phage Altwerkus]
MTQPTAWQPPQNVGDVAVTVAQAKAKLKVFSYGAAFKTETSNVYTAEFGTALRTFQQRRNAEIHEGKKPGPVMNTDGVLDWATKKQLGILPEQTAPAPPPVPANRAAALVFRGTGGIIGQDYVSQVCQQVGPMVEEINPEFPASMGGLPPGAPNLPSARQAIDIGYRSGAAWIKANPSRKFVLGGYSLGEIVVAKLLTALFSPGGELAAFRDNYVCSFHIGPPARPLGGAFYGGTAAPGVGIASNRLATDIYAQLGPRACYLCDPEDMYGSIPVPVEGGTGDIMETVYDMVTTLALNDFLNTAAAMLPHILEIAQDAGIFGLLGLGGVGPATGGGGLLGGLLGGGLGGLLGGGMANPAALLANPLAAIPLLLPLFTSALPGLIAGVGGPGTGGSLTGPAAAAQAAILGMKFLFAGTRPHIEYHIREVWPGQTYIGLAVQHVRDWVGRELPA